MAAAQSRGIQGCVTHLCWPRTTAAGREGGRDPLNPSPSMETINHCSPLNPGVLQVERGPVPAASSPWMPTAHPVPSVFLKTFYKSWVGKWLFSNLALTLGVSQQQNQELLKPQYLQTWHCLSLVPKAGRNPAATLYHNTVPKNPFLLASQDRHCDISHSPLPSETKWNSFILCNTMFLLQVRF